MTEKWELDGIDCDEIEANSSLKLDGGFDFNSTWNFEFRNQAGRIWRDSILRSEPCMPLRHVSMCVLSACVVSTHET